jgi:hypothetical protein
MILSQLVILPLLALFTWGYIRMRPAEGRGTGMMVYDVITILAAVVASIAAGWWVAWMDPAGEGSVWSMVMITVSTFHVFPGVLLVGWYLRRRIF